MTARIYPGRRVVPFAEFARRRGCDCYGIVRAMRSRGLGIDEVAPFTAIVREMRHGKRQAPTRPGRPPDGFTPRPAA